MHNYNPPNKYSHKTRMGNWSEEWELEQVKRKQYIRNRNNGTSVTNGQEKKLLKSLQSASLSYSKDGYRRFGDHVMLFNGKVEGFLVTDVYEKLLNTEQSYNVSAVRNIHACARSVFILERANLNDGFKDNILHYGQQVRIRINPLLLDKPIYLYSEPVSINRYSKVSRLQEAVFMLKQNFNTVWLLEHPDPNVRLEMTGQPITTDDTVLIKHQMTNQWLGADVKTYENTFGKQFQVLVHNFLVHNKSQNLIQEKRGVTTIDIPSRAQRDQNLWLILGASDPQQQFDQTQIKNNVVNKNTLDKKMKHLLTERGIYGIRFLHKIFKSLDKDNTGILEENDFRWALQSGKLHLTQEEVAYLSNYFKANGNNVAYAMFMKDLRGKLNQNRLKAIEDAYNRTRKLVGSKVTLEQIGKVYDAARHPEVITNKKSQKQAFNEFIWSWDNIKPGYEITIDEFAAYFEDLSAIIPRDEHFEYLLLSVFHL